MMSETSAPLKRKERGPIDPHRSAILQVWGMGKEFDRYKDALILPVMAETESIVLLPPEMATLEPLTKAPWWLHCASWLPVVFWLWFVRMTRWTLGYWCILAVTFAMGWPLLEYAMHRFFFHMPVAWAQGNGAVNVVRFLAHTVHHAHPKDRMRLITPLPMSLLIALFVLPFPMWMLTDPNESRAVICGLVLGFVFYDYVHYFLHFGNPDTLPQPLRKWAHMLKKAHANHHYAPKGMTQSFGVSHSIWDEWFGTYVTPHDISEREGVKDMARNAPHNVIPPRVVPKDENVTASERKFRADDPSLFPPATTVEKKMDNVD